MLRSPHVESCSFCSAPWSETNRLVSGPGIAICRGCAEQALLLFEDASAGPATIEPPKELGDEQLLGHLPQVASVAGQADTQLRAWVDLARDRGISWARIGEALDITRQSAWERFAIGKS